MVEYGDAPGQTSLRDVNGRYRTQSLFLETHTGSNDAPVYTLRHHEHNGLPSARQVYLEAADPTEFRAAIALLGSWEHWQRLTRTGWFQTYLGDWREELEVRLRSEGVREVRRIAGAGGQQSLMAARWLAERGWTPTKRGRPSNAEKEAERKKQARIDEEVGDDLERIQQVH